MTIALFIYNLIHSASIPAALENLGATCYMNSTLQCLYQIEPLTNFLLSEESGKGSELYKPDSVAMEYINLIKKIPQKQIKEVEIKPFCKPVFKKFFRLSFKKGKTQQQDAEEFLNQLLDHLMDTDVKESEKSNTFIPGTITKQSPAGDFIFDLFYSRIKESIEPLIANSKCKIKPQFAPYNKLNLSIQTFDTSIIYPTQKDAIDAGTKYNSLQECLTSFSSPEIRKEGYNCDGELIDIKQEKRIQSNPRYLIIALNRYVNMQIGSAAKWSSVKVNHAVSFPLYDLDLKPYMTDDSTSKETKYDLIGFVQQAGALRGGHYTSWVKSNNKWYFCNDSSIREEDHEKEVENITKNGLDRNFTPYILFYKRTDQPSQSLQQSTQALQQLEAQLQALSSRAEEIKKKG